MKKSAALISMLFLLFVVAQGLFATPVAAQLGSCIQDTKRPQDSVDLCERDGPDRSEAPAPVFAPSTATVRYIVVMDCGDAANPADQQNVSNWSDVVNVYIPSAKAPAPGPRAAQLFSQGAPFPPASLVLTNTTVFVKESTASADDDLNDTVVPDVGFTFHIHSGARTTPCFVAPPAQVPEGDTLMLVGTGLAGLAGYAALRFRARRAPRA